MCLCPRKKNLNNPPPLYDGQTIPCNSGTFSPTGLAPNGDCKCPSNLPYSPRGSNSTSQCLALNNDIYSVSSLSNRVTALNADSKQFELLTEAGVIDDPRDMEFINENLALVSSFDKHRVNIIDSEGIDSEDIDSESIDSESIDSEGIDSEGIDSEGIDHGVFASVINPVGWAFSPIS